MVSRRSASSLSRLLLDRLPLTYESLASVTSSSSGAGGSSRLTTYRLACLAPHPHHQHFPSPIIKHTAFRGISSKHIAYLHCFPSAQSAPPVVHGRHASTIVHTTSEPDTAVSSENGNSVDDLGDSDTYAEVVKARAWRAEGGGKGAETPGSEGGEPTGPRIVWIPPTSGLHDVSGLSSSSSPTVITAPPPSNAKRLPGEWGVGGRKGVGG